MINVIIPIDSKNKGKFDDLLTELQEIDDVNILIGIEKKNIEEMNKFKYNQNMTITSFNDETSIESMINFLHRYALEGSTLVLRKPITIKEFERFVNCNRDVVTCKVQRSKFKSFIFNIWQVLIKFCLGVKEYEGDTSVVYLNEDISTVVADSKNLSFSTRVNRWRGIDQTVIDVKGEPAPKIYDKKNLLIYGLNALTLLLLAIIDTSNLVLVVIALLPGCTC